MQGVFKNEIHQNRESYDIFLLYNIFKIFVKALVYLLKIFNNNQLLVKIKYLKIKYIYSP